MKNEQVTNPSHKGGMASSPNKESSSRKEVEKKKVKGEKPQSQTSERGK